MSSLLPWCFVSFSALSSQDCLLRPVVVFVRLAFRMEVDILTFVRDATQPSNWAWDTRFRGKNHKDVENRTPTAAILHGP